jgi:hypothetical protein
MRSATSSVGTERVAYYQGQLLRSRDLGDDASYETRMESLHVRAMHDTWGVALGLLLGLDQNTGRVTVGAGLAIDCVGLEIVLSTEATIGPPNAPPPGHPSLVFDLVCSRPTSIARAPVDSPACEPAAPQERADIRWEFAGELTSGVVLPPGDGVRLGEDVPLGRFVLDGEGTLFGPDPSVRRNVRPLLRPQVGWGVLDPGMLVWEYDHSGFVADVDTSSAGFTSVPLYFAALGPNPWAERADVLGPFVSIAQPSIDSFHVQLLFGRPDDKLAGQRSAAGLFWVGLEPFTGCPPAYSFVWLPFLIRATLQKPSIG